MVPVKRWCEGEEILLFLEACRRRGIGVVVPGPVVGHIALTLPGEARELCFQRFTRVDTWYWWFEGDHGLDGWNGPYSKEELMAGLLGELEKRL